MRSPGNSFRHVALFVLILFPLCGLGSTSLAQKEKKGPVPTDLHPSTSISMPDGVIQFTLPAGWEMNMRLAQDNGAPAFLHPGGTPVGQQLPFWVVVDRCIRNMAEPYPALIHRVLEEGKPYGFALQDSVGFRTADGRKVVQCNFAPTKEGENRGLAFIEIPVGALLFRFQGHNDEAWEKHRPAVGEILRTLRFLPLQTSPGAGQAK